MASASGWTGRLEARKVAPVTDFWRGGVETRGWCRRPGYRLGALARFRDEEEQVWITPAWAEKSRWSRAGPPV